MSDDRRLAGDDRKLEVLRAIIEDFVTTSEPVGSKALVERHALGVHGHHLTGFNGQLFEDMSNTLNGFSSTDSIKVVGYNSTGNYWLIGGSNGKLNRFNGTSCTDLTATLGWGVGVGPIRTGVGRAFAARALSNLGVFMGRDRRSARRPLSNARR